VKLPDFLMDDRSHYTLDDELDEAEAAARDLPDQIQRLREKVRRAKSDLASGRAGSVDQGNS
jgi:hypothetical protein